MRYFHTWGRPRSIGSKSLPSRAARWALYRDDLRLLGKNPRGILGLGYEPFPTYTTYREYENEVLRLYKWYHLPVLEIGRRAKPVPVREGDGWRG